MCRKAFRLTDASCVESGHTQSNDNGANSRAIVYPARTDGKECQNASSCPVFRPLHMNEIWVQVICNMRADPHRRRWCESYRRYHVYCVSRSVANASTFALVWLMLIAAHFSRYRQTWRHCHDRYHRRHWLENPYRKPPSSEVSALGALSCVTPKTQACTAA